MTNEISTQEETGLLEVQKLQEIVATAPEILQLNIASKTKAIEAGQKLVDAAKLGMSDFQDEQLSIFMTKAKKTIDSMNERRKPFTQIVDAVKKQFTALESDLKPIMEEIQGYRNSYATQKMLAKQEADRVALLQLNKDKELIEIRKDFEREITSCLKEDKDKLPSKKAELIEISKAGVEEKKRLEEESIKRQQEEAAALLLQQQEMERKAQEEAAINASAATAGAMIDASVASSETPNVKEGYLITLKSTAGYLLLVQFWFEKEGKTMSVDKFEKFTFDRVKRFCEAYAVKNEEFIQSPLIEYQPIYKAK